jgi:micrococcal nuclease
MRGKLHSCWLALTLVVSILSASAATAADKYYGTAHVSAVTSIYDADTFRATIAGWPAIVGERIPIRVAGIDAPELRGKCQEEKELARQAKQRTVTLLRSAMRIELRNMQRGKYFRIVADVFVDDRDLASILVAEGLARPYDGGTKATWCY